MNAHRLAILALLIGACSGQTLQGYMTTKSPWNGVFDGELVIPITEKVSGGWYVQVRFSAAVTGIEIWLADVENVSPDNKVYTLKNKSWNPKLEAGTTLTMSFRGTIDGVESPTATVVLFGSGPPPEGNTLAPPPTLGQSGAELEGELRVEETWPGGFQGFLEVYIPQRITGGWTMKVTFSKRVKNLEIWDAEIDSIVRKREYTFVNKQWNAELAQGTTLSMAIVGQLYGGRAPSAIITLHPATLHPFVPTTPGPTEGPMTTLISGAELEGVLKITESRPNGFEGILEVYVPQRVTRGWTMEVKFSKRVKNLQIWDADVISNYRNKDYSLQNKAWNAELAQGSTLSMSIVGEIISGRPPTAEVTLYPNAMYPYEPMGTTALPPATTDSAATERPVTVSKKPVTEASTDGRQASSTLNPPEPSTGGRQASSTLNPPEPSETTRQPSPTDPGTIGPYDYNEVLNKSILFYEAQRSGKLPPNNRISWRSDSTLSDFGPNGEDLTGGWFDAGDFVKFGLPMAWSATNLAWGLIQYREAYLEAGQLSYMLDCLRWATDYFLKCHTDENTFYAQVGDGDIDHAYWGRPEDLPATMSRPAFSVTSSKPGSDVAGQTAAALAASSLAFVETDPLYAVKLLENAVSLFQFADNFRGKYSDSIPEARNFYQSYSGYGDELALAATWLYLATDEVNYLNKAKQFYGEFGLGGTPWAYSWDDNTAAVQLLLHIATNGDAAYGQAVSSFLNGWFPNGNVHYTPKGLAWRDQWGSLRYSANAAFLALVAADQGISPQQSREFARSQIHYMLGDAGRSFVVGFGENPPQRPHHSSSSCRDVPAPCNWDDFNSPDPNPQVLYGALVGGPDRNDNYNDVRSDYVSNEVACDYNAGFQSAVAGLKNLQIAVKR
ncbi:uncharacterized protein [Ptychodera flava]|uniref:uncharacterized protein isoform X1 n=1 Tax=Ptychodera flava TaxID=63121 RepID=UPI00396A15A4